MAYQVEEDILVDEFAGALGEPVAPHTNTHAAERQACLIDVSDVEVCASKYRDRDDTVTVYVEAVRLTSRLDIDVDRLHSVAEVYVNRQDGYVFSGIAVEERVQAKRRAGPGRWQRSGQAVAILKAVTDPDNRGIRREPGTDAE